MKEKKSSLFARFFSSVFALLTSVFNAVLALAAFILLVLFTAFYFKISFEIPKDVVRNFEDYAANSGVALEVDSAEFCFDGRVHLSEVNANFLQEPISFYAKELSFKIDMFRLIAGRLNVKDLLIDGGQIKSKFGASAEKNLIEKFSVFLIKSDTEYKLAFCNAQLSNLGILASGDVSFTGLEKFLEDYLLGASSNDSFASSNGDSFFNSLDFASICDKIYQFELQISRVDSPLLTVNFSVSQNANLEISAELNANAFSSEIQGQKVEAKNFSAFAKYDYAKSKNSFNLDAHCTRLNVKNEISCERAVLSCCVDFEKISLSDFSVCAFDLKYGGVNVDALSVYPLIDSESFCGTVAGFAKLGGGDISFDAVYLKNSAKINYGMQLITEELFKSDFLRGLEEIKMFAFGDGVYLKGTADISFSEPTFDKIKISTDAIMLSENCRIMDVDIDSVFANVHFNSDTGELRANNLAMKSKEGWSLRGSIYQNILNMDYAFILTGTLRPMSIAHFMEPWWRDIFEKIDIHKEFANVDVAVESRWGQPEIVYAYARVDAKNIARGGVEFDRANTFIWVTPERIALCDLSIQNENRRMSGLLEWTYPDHKIVSYDENRIIIDSSLNIRELIGLAGERVEKITETISFKEAPELSLVLYMPNSAKYENPIDSLNLTCATNSPVKIGKFNFDRIKFGAFAKGNDIFVQNFDARWAGGKLGGSFNLLDKNKRDFFEANLDFSELNVAEFLRQLHALDASGDEKDAWVAPENTKSGKLLGKLKMKGYTDNVKSIYAKGNIELDNPKLANINLFGAISRTANAMNIPLGSFDFNKLTSSIEISNAVMEFDDLKVVGPSAEILGSLHYNFLSDAVNAKLMFIPFSKIEVPIVSEIFSLFNPFFSAIEIDIKGSYADPDISLGVDPFNIFRNDKKIIEIYNNFLDDEIGEIF